MDASLPSFREWGAEDPGKNTKDQPEAVFPDTIWESLGEEFRSLRTRVVHALGNEKNKILLVVSAIPREGKTFVAVNLSRAMAEASWRTLLIDGDMRASAVHSMFGLQRCEGLSDILHQERFIPESIRRSTILGLDIMTAGTHTERPAELVNKPFVHIMHEELRHRYDYTIVDSAPLIPVTDAFLQAGHVDGILIVVESGKTPREEVRKILEQFNGRPVLGLVMNGVDRQARYNYYRY